eukprot:12395194-Alexandrium_andersonii.AAC.1
MTDFCQSSSVACRLTSVDAPVTPGMTNGEFLSSVICHLPLFPAQLCSESPAAQIPPVSLMSLLRWARDAP